ncbi:MAG: mandelate racemase/muconate lactonizing enzyme family protein [Proteobacteria bacterium]|nr:mandelate racemase/muconate lactonizing enzyme family protein [Pseudomonadota bacterium]
MKITRLETFTDPFVCFVRVTTADGAQGWGQTSTYHADITAQVFHRQVAPWVLGGDPRDIAGLVRLVEEREHKYPGSYRCRALAGLDTALWDWRGRQEGRSVAALLGATRTSLRAYASSMKRDITPEEEAARLVRLRDEQGFDAFKWRVGAECGRDVDEWPGRTEAVVPTVARALGPGVAKLVDANSGFSPARAIAVGHLLQDEGIVHYEEPCPYWELEQSAEVTAALALDVTGGEQDWDFNIWRRMMALKAVNVLQPDVMYMGGLTRTLQLCAMADAAGFTITPHSANLSLVTVCTAHLLAAIPNAGPYLEFSIEGPDYYPWQQDLFLGDPFRIEAGRMAVPEGPGWGVEINPAWLERASYQSSELEA